MYRAASLYGTNSLSMAVLIGRRPVGLWIHWAGSSSGTTPGKGHSGQGATSWIWPNSAAPLQAICCTICSTQLVPDL